MQNFENYLNRTKRFMCNKFISILKPKSRAHAKASITTKNKRVTSHNTNRNVSEFKDSGLDDYKLMENNLMI